MPPPRFVRRNSTSALRNVSIFSGKLGTDSTTAGVADGKGETSGAGEGLAPAISGVVVGDAASVDGRGGAWRAAHHCQALKPMTQSVTAIHAVRSRNVY